MGMVTQGRKQKKRRKSTQMVESGAKQRGKEREGEKGGGGREIER